MADVSFKREFLEAHNSYRKLHGAPPLALSSELNATAQKWADRLLALGLMNHSDTKDGENIYTVLKSEQLTAKEAVDSWYSEVKDYNWNNPGLKSNTGHFTQVVWKETTQLGVGVATVGTRSYVVAQYRPAGNMTMPGKFESNVLRQGSNGARGSGGSSTGGGDGGKWKRREKSKGNGQTENTLCCTLL